MKKPNNDILNDQMVNPFEKGQMHIESGLVSFKQAIQPEIEKLHDRIKEITKNTCFITVTSEVLNPADILKQNPKAIDHLIATYPDTDTESLIQSVRSYTRRPETDTSVSEEEKTVTISVDLLQRLVDAAYDFHPKNAAADEGQEILNKLEGK